jgi:hypothetical protein
MGPSAYRRHRDFPGRISTVMLELIIALGVNALFGIGVVALWCKYLGSKPAKKPTQVGWRREAIEINSANVPKFEPTWRSQR